MKKTLTTVALSLFLSLLLPLPSWAETVLEEIKRTGVYLLVKPENQEFVIPSGSLQNVTIGVLPASLTKQFIKSRYPLARITDFSGIDGRKNAVEAVINNRLTTFASDGLLMIGEVLRNPNVNSNDYALVPNEPLTCEFYGMILPQGDTSWLNTVNSLILVQESVEILRQLFGSNSDYVKTTESALQKCVQ